MKNNILITGGSGTLGKELHKYFSLALYPPHVQLDITNTVVVNRYFEKELFDMVIHAAAFISPPQIDKNPLLALQTNIIGTANIVQACIKYGKKLVYISTDYVFDGKKGNYIEEDSVYPINKYAWSKLGGECAVRLMDDYLIIRTSFGPETFPYEKAFIDQWTSREVVSAIAKKISILVNKNAVGTFHIGGLKKSVYEYATKNEKNTSIKKASIMDVPFTLPKDTSLNVDKYKKFTGCENG